MNQNMNLLPQSYRVRQAATKTVFRWLGITVVIVALTCCWGLQDVLRSQVSREAMHNLREESEPVREAEIDVRRLRMRMEGLREQKTLEGQLAERRSLTDLMGIISGSSKSCDGEVCVRSLDLKQVKNQNDDTLYTLSLSGVGTDDLVIARFAAALRDSNAFSKVQLSSTSPISENEIAARSYTMECSY
jgi:hypothetical protein